MSTYQLISVKATRTITGSIADAVAAALAMDADLQPAFGVSVEDEGGATVAEVDEGRVEYCDQ